MPRRRVRSCLVMALVAACMTACREADIVTARPDPLRVVLSASAVGLCVGELHAVSAEVQGDPRILERELRFVVADSTVAEIVDQTSTEVSLRGLAFGRSTTLFAFLRTDATIADSATVTVSQCTWPVPSLMLPSMTIGSAKTPVHAAQPN